MYPGQYSKQWQYCIAARLPYSYRQSCGVSVVSSLLTSALLVLAYKASARVQVERTNSLYTSLLTYSIVLTQAHWAMLQMNTEAMITIPTRACVCMCSDRGQVRV